MELNTWLKYQSSASAYVGTAGQVIKASAGRLRSIGGASNDGSINHYLVGVDKATAPVADDAALFAIPLSATTSFGTSAQCLDFGIDCIYFATGIAYAVSTTPYKVTLAASNNAFVWALYD